MRKNKMQYRGLDTTVRVKCNKLRLAVVYTLLFLLPTVSIKYTTLIGLRRQEAVLTQ